MNFWRTLRTVMSLIPLLLLAETGFGDQVLPVTWRLVADNGQAVSGETNLSIRFFSAATGGSPLGAPLAISDVPLVAGVAKLELILADSVWNDIVASAEQAVWIEVHDVTRQRLYPRQRFGIVPAALKVPIDSEAFAWDMTGKLGISDLAGSHSNSAALSGGGGNEVLLTAPGALTSSVVLTMPVDNGSNDDVLTTDGTGALVWTPRVSGTGNMSTTDYDNPDDNMIDLAAGGSGVSMAATGGTGHYVKQSAVGGLLSAGIVPDVDLPATIARDSEIVAIDSTSVNAAGAVMDADFTNGLMLRTGAGLYSQTTDDSINWNTAYTDRLKWDGGATGLNAGTAWASLGLLSMAGQGSGAVAVTGGSLTGVTFTTPSFADDAISGDKIHNGTISDFASFGIDDNANALAVTIDSSERIGIGQATPAYKLDVTGSLRLTSPLAVPDGSPALPALSFASDNASGLTYEGPGALTFVTAGTRRLIFDAAKVASYTDGSLAVGQTGQLWLRAHIGSLLVGAGTAATPSFSFNADAGVGIYNFGVNALSIATAGAARLTIDSAGLVGVGTTGPAAELDVAGQLRVAQVCDISGANCIDASDGWEGAMTCPSGYVRVPADGKFSLKDFCVMKYEAKQDAATKRAVSTAAGQPWTNASWYEASAACKRAGAHLITDGEWMTIARNIEATAINDIDATAGLQFSNGHSDNSPASALSGPSSEPSLAGCDIALSLANAANSACALRGSGAYLGDDTDAGYFGTSNHFSQAYTAGSANKSQLRTHVLSNQEVVWDVGGNISEWTASICDSTNWSATAGPTQWSNAALTDFEKPVGGPSASLTSTNGVGQYGGCTTTANAFNRGGSYTAGAATGIYRLYLENTTDYSSGTTGFRCAYSRAP